MDVCLSHNQMAKAPLMLRLCAALLLYLTLASAAQAENTVGPSNAILCNKVAIQEVGFTTATILVPAIAGQTIFICGWNVTNTGANASVAFTSGTFGAANCDTGTKKLSPSFTVSSNSPNQDHIQIAGNSSNLSQAVCITSSAVTVSVMLWYSQF